MVPSQERSLDLLERLLPLIERLPKRPGSVLVAAGINLAISRGEAPELQALAGKVIAIRVADADVRFHFTVSEGGFAACSASRPADVVISAAAADFVRLALRRVDADTLFFSRRLTMEGDTELGLLLKNRLDALDFSWSVRDLPKPRELARALGRAAGTPLPLI